jgi:membrane-associated phospholipid phosphatase
VPACASIVAQVALLIGAWTQPAALARLDLDDDPATKGDAAAEPEAELELEAGAERPLAEPETVAIVPVPSPPRPEPKLQAPLDEREPAPEPGPPDLHFRWEVDIPLLVGAGAIWLGTELSLEHLTPATPRWTRATAGELAIREALVWRSPATARKLSDAFAFAVVPLFGLTLTLADVGRSQQWRVLHEDLLIVLETVAVASMLTQILKLSTARGRPYTYEAYAAPDGRPIEHLLLAEPDSVLSFPSGHASLAFTFATSFATVASMRERKLAPYLWGFGMPLAGFAAYLRVAGHRHWFSDVIVGSTLGAAVGAGLPLLLHHPRFGLLARLGERPGGARVHVVPSGHGATLIGQF